MQDPALDVSQSFRTGAARPGGAMTAEVIDVADMPRLRAAWRDLYGRSLESNIFLDPDFAAPALAYLHPRGLKILAVFDAAPGRRLLALAPVVPPRLPFGAARVYVHKQAALGLPLLDRALAAPALTALIDAVKTLPMAPGALIFGEIPDGGPTARLLGDVFGESGRLNPLGRYERAALCLAPASQRRVPRKTKAGQNSFRRLRRLSERGALSYRVVRGGDVPAAMREFLALEASGWKGASKTALGSTPERAAFASGIAETLGRAGKLWIESLDLDGKSVAMGILLQDDTAYFWKTAYNEAYASLSPGVLLARELTSRLTASPAPLRIDSCASANHPVIDHLWPQRIAMLDIGLALAPGVRGHLALKVEGLRRRLRKIAKSLLRRSAGGKARLGATALGTTLGTTWRARS